MVGIGMEKATCSLLGKWIVIYDICCPYRMKWIGFHLKRLMILHKMRMI